MLGTLQPRAFPQAWHFALTLAGRALVADGCSAIATRCGFLALWQRELQAMLAAQVQECVVRP